MEHNETHLNEKEKVLLSSAFENILPPPYLQSQVIAELYKKKLLKSKGITPWLRYGFTLLIGILFFSWGWWLASQYQFKKNQTMTTSKQNQYMLLLHNNEGFINAYEQQVKEYGDWMRTLVKEGKVSGGDELADKGFLVKPDGYTVINTEKQMADGQVSGYFVIAASSQEEALSIAETCPHLKYNGTIELRPIKK